MNPLLKDIFTEAATVIKLARDNKMTVGTAESCTGGLIGAAITSIPGSSKIFKGGIIAYANSVKNTVLDIPPGMIEEHGAVSEPVSRSMAMNSRERLGVDLAISVTGIAGPGGGSPQKPVGTVWLGLATQDGARTKLLELGDIGRNKIRDVTCLEALKMLSAALEA